MDRPNGRVRTGAPRRQGGIVTRTGLPARWSDSADALQADGQPAVDIEPSPPPAPTWARVACESDLLRILDSTVPGEAIAVLYDRREHELVELFSCLTATECLELHRRLLSSCSDDPVAMRFQRMIPQRRNRLLAFLADVRRRETRAERQLSRRRSP
jgi:hypothetical protein